MNIKEKYKDNPVAFAEEVLCLELMDFQKEILNLFHKNRDKQVHLSVPYRYGKRQVLNIVVEYWKAMGLSFNVLKNNQIDVYIDGVLEKQP